MPYIKPELRYTVDKSIEQLKDLISSFPEFQIDGVLNYTFTKLLINSFEKESYLNYERMIGILECCKLELYRRKISEYENKKIIENGDVFNEK